MCGAFCWVSACGSLCGIQWGAGGRDCLAKKAISGKVVDSKGEAIIGANIMEKAPPMVLLQISMVNLV